MTWAGFAGVFALFLVTHSVPVRPAIKSRIVAAVGARWFSLGYSVLSIGMLSLLIWAAGQAPFVELWPQMAWHRHVVHLGMLAVCLILALSIARPNPFSFGGARNADFDPRHPGMVRYTRHPILIAMSIWAALHMLPNGDLAHVLLFGTLGSFALVGRQLINRRKRREMGADAWDTLNASVAKAPYIATSTSLAKAAIRLAAGLVAFAILLLLHPIAIGVTAL